MDPANIRKIEEGLIRDVLGWHVVDDPRTADAFPAVFWSSRERAFMLVRSSDARPTRFSPARCLRDCLEVRKAIGDDRFHPRIARPVWEGNVRVVADFGSEEVVVEARSLAWTLSAAIYKAASDGLM